MKVFLKLGLLIIPISLFIGFNVFYNLNATSSILFEKNASYLIGSSRVKQGLNPEFIKHSNKHIYNVGITSATFFNNVMLAEHLMKESEPKELFIELSPIIYTFSETQKSLGVKYSSAYKHLLRFNSFHPKEIIDIVELMLFYNLSLTANLKKALIYLKIKSPEKSSNAIGYEDTKQNIYFYTDSFLKYTDIETKYDVDIFEYKYYITYLNQLANKHNVKIRYFLPLTFNRQEERELVCTVYQCLPDAMKVKYSKSFIQQISRPEYLFNKNHFNYKGAEIMTEYFRKLYFN